MHSVYPRPQLKRDRYYDLNGVWEFSVTDGEPPRSYPDTIRVPYPPESPLSGLERRILPNESMWYRRTFDAPEYGADERVILHFGAVDQFCEVLLNDTLVTRHAGGYLPFSADITDLLRAENELVVNAVDTLDHAFPWGKQKQKNGGMWYTPFSGIWQTVWLEVVPETHVTALSFIPGLDSVTIGIETNGVFPGAHVTIETGTEPIRIAFSDAKQTVPIPDPVLWTPEHPHLYPVTIECGSDRVRSYFALRTVSIGERNGVPRLLLNGEPYFFHGLLDQGYWPDGICLPPDGDGYERDILAAKAQGFNTLRKHIRVEPLPFYEACDRLGMLVVQDFVNNGEYRFFRDTVLPTIGIRRMNDRHRNRDPRVRKIFTDTAKETIRHLFNAPCIAGWTIFNEGWGQFCADDVYRELKPLDPTRFFDATSGWFAQKESDVISEHVYFRKFRPKPGKKPLLLSEFGGYVFTEQAGKKYGYRFFTDPAAYRGAVEKLYREQILPAVEKGLCGAVYTQISDVEQERNGILSYDRKTVKTDPERMKALAEDLQATIRE
ncbi:MAG: glycoside hydrolase family 2 [Clostridia bacterium]|nr:glycoside hydrolase family 2 [Clostridia bacterium]